MWLWMYVTRLPAMRKAGIDAKNLVGGNGADLRARIPAKDQWPADNYNHLMEQPTLFYAIALVLALMNFGGGFNLVLAWAYVALRIVHSLVQVTSNRVIIRFSLFTLSTVCLIGLTLHAGLALLHGH